MVVGFISKDKFKVPDDELLKREEKIRDHETQNSFEGLRFCKSQ